MEFAFDYQGQDCQKERGQKRLPEDELEWCRYPVMRPRVKNAHRPGQRRQEQESIAQNGVAIGPIKCRRVEHHREAGEAEHDPNQLPRRQIFLEQ
jgi:hypothetical protein